MSQRCMTCRLSVNFCTCGRPPILGGTGYWERRLEGMTRDLETAVLALDAVKKKYDQTTNQLAIRIAEQNVNDCPNCGSLMEIKTIEASHSAGSGTFRNAKDDADDLYLLDRMKTAQHGDIIDFGDGRTYKLQLTHSVLKKEIKKLEATIASGSARLLSLEQELAEARARIAELEETGKEREK